MGAGLTPADEVAIDLMAALEKSVREAREANKAAREARDAEAEQLMDEGWYPGW